MIYKKQIQPHIKPVEKYKTDVSSTKKLNINIRIKAYAKHRKENLSFLNIKANPYTAMDEIVKK